MSNRSLQALIFDVDGTLADTERVHLEAFNHAFTEEGMDWHWDEGAVDTVMIALEYRSGSNTL